jgi:hypothetical protein
MGRKMHGSSGRTIEALESRDLPSAISALAGPAPAHVRAPGHAAAEVRRARADASSAGGGGAPSGPNQTFSLGPNSLNLSGLSSSSVTTTAEVSGVPTPAERRREDFTAVFYGPYIIGPPRFSGDTSQTYTSSGGVSSSFQKGNLELGFQTPSSPASGPVGSATLYPKNYIMTGSFLVLQIQGSPTDSRDGRATSFTWVITTASSGLYSNATGSGTLQLIYHGGSPNGGYLHAHAWGTGNVSAIFRGTMLLNGTSNPLRINSI